MDVVSQKLPTIAIYLTLSTSNSVHFGPLPPAKRMEPRKNQCQTGQEGRRDDRYRFIPLENPADWSGHENHSFLANRGPMVRVSRGSL